MHCKRCLKRTPKGIVVSFVSSPLYIAGAAVGTLRTLMSRARTPHPARSPSEPATFLRRPVLCSRPFLTRFVVDIVF